MNKEQMIMAHFQTFERLWNEVDADLNGEMEITHDVNCLRRNLQEYFAKLPARKWTYVHPDDIQKLAEHIKRRPVFIEATLLRLLEERDMLDDSSLCGMRLGEVIDNGEVPLLTDTRTLAALLIYETGAKCRTQDIVELLGNTLLWGGADTSEEHACPRCGCELEYYGGDPDPQKDDWSERSCLNPSCDYSFSRGDDEPVD